jgi:AraC-like DNA-binding protein
MATARKYRLDSNWVILFKEMGISPQDILRHAGLPLDLFSQKSPTVNADEYLSLWDGIDYMFRDRPTAPIQMMEMMRAEVFSPPIFACFCSANLNMAVSRLAYYKPIVGPMRLIVEETGDYTRVTFSGLPDTRPVPNLLMLFEHLFWVQIVRLGTREHIVPLMVQSSVDVPDPAAYEDYLGVPVERAETNSITFTAADARRPFLSANDAMWDIFEPELRRRMDDLTREASFRERVRACLTEIIASGHYSMNDVASKLAVSPRTLQRRLKQEGTSFQKELDDLREQLARHYLSTTDHSIAQVAFLLGYNEPNSFFRAFRTWTGDTPDSVRSGAMPS